MGKIILMLVLSIFLISACAQQKANDAVGRVTKVPVKGMIVKEFKVTAKQFAFEPSTIEVNKGERVKLIVTSLDVPHGIVIPEYGINQKLDPNKPVAIEFTADKEGTFTILCSVFCGSGHSGMKGKLIVK